MKREKPKPGNEKYLIDSKGIGMADLAAYGEAEFPDWFEHKDVITLEGINKKFVVWDPWYNRFFRWAFGGHLKRLNYIGNAGTDNGGK
jgi:hypothetical protein